MTIPSPSQWDLALSPFASILGTNHAPSINELAELKSSLIVPKRELSRLDSEIATLQGILDGLSSSRAQIKQYIDAHQSLMSPVRQIPSETLSRNIRLVSTQCGFRHLLSSKLGRSSITFDHDMSRLEARCDPDPSFVDITSYLSPLGYYC
ncbi:hypothetical protein BT96DRAFT_475732 [Gymnopus androsaceus JB14]|uniref:Uncharacterized protein n=1 Tax=Gymnopus androsaceus JB14 TaxID=1447944 RepID=A0A6A4GR70_9AGAR|nr:hypothetical protein BT96DRAFT_475732 [Gymnopus androsaceus JB14]